MGKINKGIMLLMGIMAFMIIFPTTFLVELGGGSMLQKVLKQVHPFFNL
jgi:hypothetical protein